MGPSGTQVTDGASAFCGANGWGQGNHKGCPYSGRGLTLHEADAVAVGVSEHGDDDLHSRHFRYGDNLRRAQRHRLVQVGLWVVDLGVHGIADAPALVGAADAAVDAESALVLRKREAVARRVIRAYRPAKET